MDNIFVAVRSILAGVYSEISGIITLLCVVFLSICLIGMAVCKNQKTVDEFRAWRNRIAWAWVIFNLLGSIIAYLEGKLGGYSYIDDTSTGP